MSNLEKGAISLDEARAKRLMIDHVDFDAYMNGRDNNCHEAVKPASHFEDELNAYFDPNNEASGDCMPWSKTADQIRFRHSEVSIWNGINGHGKSAVLGQI